jgi:hypothetical protein
MLKRHEWIGAQAVALCFLTYLSMSVQPVLGQEVQCDSKSNRVHAVTNPSLNATTSVDFSFTAGELDPNPLLQTMILVDKYRRSCIIAHFSALVTPHGLNHLIFQVSVDGKAMAGHTRFPFIASQPDTLVVWESGLSQIDENSTQLVAYNFFQEVDPGQHLIEVRFATCCTGGAPEQRPAPPILVRTAALTLEYNE